ncbi:hypothetical protein GCM10027563_12250 [Parasphingorhabdus pacifica]
MPTAVYWRRRAVALATGVLAVLFIVWLAFLLFAGAPEPAPAEQPRPPVAVSAPPPEPKPCAEGAVRVTAEPVRQEVPIGERIPLRIAVANGGEVECVQDTDGMLRELVVSAADGRRLWSSNDCYGETTNQSAILQPGEVRYTEVLWSGHTSLPGCPTERRAVNAGEYQLVAKLGDLTSAPVPFRLTGGA